MNLRGDINIAQKKMSQYRVPWYIITKKSSENIFMVIVKSQ